MISSSSLENTLLTWDEMIYLHKNKLALRGVASKEHAFEEKQMGGTGDAVSLATFGFPGLAGLEIRKRVNEFMGTVEKKENLYDNNILNNAYLFLCFKEVMNDYPEDMQALQLHLLKGIKDHVQSCIHHYSAGAFVVMKHHADSPYDYHLYTLGKCGKRSFKPSAVKAIIAPAAEGTWDEQFAYQQIILAIKKLYRQNQLDHHSAHALSELSQFSVSRPLIQETPEKSKKSACVRCIIL